MIGNQIVSRCQCDMGGIGQDDLPAGIGNGCSQRYLCGVDKPDGKGDKGSEDIGRSRSRGADRTCWAGRTSCSSSSGGPCGSDCPCRAGRARGAGCAGISSSTVQPGCAGGSGGADWSCRTGRARGAGCTGISSSTVQPRGAGGSGRPSRSCGSGLTGCAGCTGISSSTVQPGCAGGAGRPSRSCGSGLTGCAGRSAHWAKVTVAATGIGIRTHGKAPLTILTHELSYACPAAFVRKRERDFRFSLFPMLYYI